ncbi:hypothetical protein PM8797T_04750 [Gimesia maris DSM 8797]|nr:hypothetical protein PM8797T_04750 [Gimesia maris DSM 8797]
MLIEKESQRKYDIISVIPAIGTLPMGAFLLVRKGFLKGNAGCQNA